MKKFATHFFLSIILFFIAVLFTSPLVFFVTDVGLRYLQIQNLIAHNWTTFAIDYPAAFLDPNFEFVPFYYAYSVINHEIYLNISPFLPMLSSVLYKIVGIPGLAIIPVLGAVFSGWAIKKLFKLHELPFPDLMFWLVILATPILFYCMQIWDHTIGVAFALWAAYFAVKGVRYNNKREMLWAGILLSLGMGQRQELYVFAIALAAGIALAGNFNFAYLGFYFLGGFIGIVPIWILQYLWFGHPLGIIIGGQFLGYGRPEHYPFPPTHRLELPRFTKISLLLFQIDQLQPVLTVVILLLIFIGLFLIVYAFRKRYSLSIVFIGLLFFVLGHLISLIKYFGQSIQGFLSTFPLIPLSIMVIPYREGIDDPRSRQGYKLIGLSTLFFSIIILFFWPADGGYQWGSRYLLPVYPLLFYMAIYTFSRLNTSLTGEWQKALQITTITLIIVSIALQIMSLYTLSDVYKNQVLIRDSIETLPAKYILTNAPYLQSYMVSTDKTFLYVDNSEILTDALSRLAAKGLYDFAVIPLDQIELEVPDHITDYKIEKISEFVYHLYPE